MSAFRKISLLLPKLSLRKVINFTRIWMSYHYSKLRAKPYHRGNPVKIGVEPTTSCNLRCPECISGLRAFTRPTGMLDMRTFRKVIDETCNDLIYLLMYFQGEPYLNPDFLEMVKYADSKGVYTATSTNGHYLDDENARATILSGLSELVISVDGATQETYSAYRIGGELEKVRSGIRNVVKWRKHLGTKHPYIILQFLVVKPNEHELEDIRRMGKELGVDKVLFKTAQIYDYENGHELIPSNHVYSRYKLGADGKYHLKYKIEDQCWRLWQGAEITWDGKVLPCCFDKDAEHEMGNVLESAFSEIWRNPAYDTFRGQLLRSRKEIEMCRNCTEGTKVWA